MAQTIVSRSDQRLFDQIRPINLRMNICEYAAGSVLIEMGKTKVLCNISLQNGIPLFMRDKTAGGWLTAEYSMIPMAAQMRMPREATQQRRNNRSLEISRLIGRVFRSVVNLDAIGQKTIYIDCDVLQADGGTRTAAITGSWLAFKMAEENWMRQGLIAHKILTSDLIGISVGMKNNNFLLDLDFSEDFQSDVDFNFVLTREGLIIEVQGTAEKGPIPWEAFEQMKQLALKGAQDIFLVCDGL